MSEPIRRCALCTVEAVDSVISPGDTYLPHRANCPLAAHRNCPHCLQDHSAMTVTEALRCTLRISALTAQSISDVVLWHLEHEEEER